jgi:hypothetical protein
VPVFRRLRPEFPFVEVRLSDLIGDGRAVISSECRPFDTVMKRVYDEIRKDSRTFRRVPETEMSDDPDDYEREFLRLVGEATDGDIPLPGWKFEIQIRLKRLQEDEVYVLNVLLVNTGEDGDPLGREKIEDTFLFDACLEAEFESAKVVPFEFHSLDDSYRYDREMLGIGLNCTVKPLSEEHPNRGLRTVSAPVVRQKRYGTRRYLPEEIGGRRLTELTFESLRDDPVKTLRSLLADMKDYCRYWGDNKIRFMKDRRYEDKFVEDLNNYRKEIERFERGIEILETPKYEPLNKAFRLMNEAFLKKEGIRSKGYRSWRPFQIVFIVTQLPDIAALHWRDDFKDNNNLESPEVLWFPTGGGKTEAYLGLTVCCAFFDRLRGKKTGVTALLRFPLRLLSAQQLERLTDIMGAAELVRLGEGIDGDPFSVGLWAGESQTPNNISRRDADAINEDPERDKKYRRIHNCPFCGRESVRIRFDYERWRLIHECTSDVSVCQSGGKALPIYIVDYEIYRYLPTAIVSTVDKIALCGYQTRFANLFGDIGYVCDKHGYMWEKKCRWCGGRTAKKIEGIDRRILIPSLEIQDELHLIKEDLGAFDSHYETFVIKMQKDISKGKAWKNIASTATIKRFDYHVNHLYCRDGDPYRFPVPGPSWEESFYSDTDPGRIGRFFLGIMPHNKTHINATVDILWYFHREIQRLRRLSGIKLAEVLRIDEALDDEQANRILDEYEMSLTYVLTKRGGDQVAESIGSQVNSYLMRDGYSEVRNEMMTGSTTGAKITALLKEMQQDYRDKDVSERIRSVTATSMISHGVDIDRFNFMVFFGMPRQTAEYIQASSRVGRKSPGISVICFAPARERDRSHYHYFEKYHEYTERLVEPPAINRWSKFSINKTLPGLFTAVILNKYSRAFGKSMYKKRNWFGAINSIDENDVKKYLYDAYRTDSQRGEGFKAEVDRCVDDYFYILRNERTSENLPEALGSNRKPMRSLRDIDEPIGFVPERGWSILIDNQR